MAELLKNLFFKTDFIEDLANSIKENYSDFNEEGFVNTVLANDYEQLELKQKMKRVSYVLHDFLPNVYPEALSILRKVASGFKGFNALVFSDFVEAYGLDHPDLSLDALEVFTQLESAEFAIRHFLIKYPEKTLERMLKWSKNANEMVRRLSSEGTRPRLPWAISVPYLKKDPSPIFPILENLKNDRSENVRRSVANNLNDISKDHPEMMLDICVRWFGKSAEGDRLIKHACRGLLKKGDKRAMLLFGFSDPAEINILNFKIEDNNIRIGDQLGFQFELEVLCASESILRLEYAVYYRKKNNDFSKKVYHIGESKYKPGKYLITRKRSFANISTRKFYSGEHIIALIINGVEKERLTFNLMAK